MQSRMREGTDINENERGSFSEKDNGLMIVIFLLLHSRRVAREVASMQSPPDCPLTLVNLLSL